MMQSHIECAVDRYSKRQYVCQGSRMYRTLGFRSEFTIAGELAHAASPLSLDLTIHPTEKSPQPSIAMSIGERRMRSKEVS